MRKGEITRAISMVMLLAGCLVCPFVAAPRDKWMFIALVYLVLIAPFLVYALISQRYGLFTHPRKRFLVTLLMVGVIFFLATAVPLYLFHYDSRQIIGYSMLMVVLAVSASLINHLLAGPVRKLIAKVFPKQ